MSAYAEIQYLRDTELWRGYTPEWKEWKRQETPEIEWKYWLKSQPWRDCPMFFLSYFCNEHTTGYWKFSEKYNFRVCNECGKLPLNCWPLFVFECDECEEPFVIQRYPVHYHLCLDCGGG
jgi:hypothetical protein